MQDEVRERLSGLSRSAPPDVRSFLLAANLNKDPLTRTFAWVLALDLTSPLNPDLSRLYQNYAADLARRQASLSDPNSAVVTASTQAIADDIVRIVPWLARECEALALPESYLRDAQQRTTRLLAMLRIDPPYLQGYDRYALVCYGLLLRVAVEHGLGPDFAEAIAYFLASELIRIGNIPQFLNGDASQRFAPLDRELKQVAPDVARSLSAMNLSSTHFALRWALVLFADEHSLPEIWLLWDAIIAHRANASLFVRQLSVAHVLQVPVRPSEMAIESLQRNRKWDVPELIRVARERVAPPWKGRQNCLRLYDISACVLIALVFFWMLYGRFR
jgi:hypothetical protein